MKKTTLLYILIIGFSLTVSSQRVARMAAIFTPGYYINFKGDTIRGQIQINPEKETDFYRQFAFITGKAKRPKIMNVQRIRGYGFKDKHFVAIDYDGQKLFAERLITGRLRFYEYKYDGKIDGYPAVESAYFVKDTGADEADLKKPTKISDKFYKKSLKPFMKDQPMIWSDLDKYTFSRDGIVSAIREFNQFYVRTGN